MMSLSHPELNGLSRSVIGAAMAVHKELGPGLLESIYEEAFYWELTDSGFIVRRQDFIPIVYKNHRLQGTYRSDLVVNDSILIEAKALEEVKPVHKAQVLTYMKLTGLKVGLLLNFNCASLANGITRISL